MENGGFDLHMPTGLTSLDPVFDGGVPPGSVILLKGDIGSGKVEFIYSIMIFVSQLMVKGSDNGSIILPNEIRYITLTRRKESIIREIFQSFNAGLLTDLDQVNFNDLSDIYFDSSLVPITWYTDYNNIFDRMSVKRQIHDNLLTTLSYTLDGVKEKSMVIIDSLTQIAPQYSSTGNWSDLSAYLRGLQRVSKKWNTTVYLLLTKGVLNQYQEIEIADAVDAVIHFKWEDNLSARRQRVLYIEKFRGVMIHLEDKDLVKFAVKITSERGFEVTNIRVVI